MLVLLLLDFAVLSHFAGRVQTLYKTCVEEYFIRRNCFFEIGRNRELAVAFYTSRVVEIYKMLLLTPLGLAWKSWTILGNSINKLKLRYSTIMQPSNVTPFKPKAGRTFRALVSVTDKTGLERLKPLLLRGAEFISTGGTATELRTVHGIPCTEVSDITKFPEMLDGRVKLLHPNIFAGLLAEQGTVEHMETIARHGILPFQAVFLNLYDFENKPGIAQIDVGGPSAIRAAAKNGLIVVINVHDYDRIVAAICASEDGSIPEKLRLELVAKVFRYTSNYDRRIADYFEAAEVEGKNPFLAVNPSSH